MTTLPQRADVPVQETWRLEDIYPDRAAWEAGLNGLEPILAGLAKNRGRLGEGPGVLLACLKAWEEGLEQALKLSSYAQMQVSADALSPQNQGDADRADAAIVRFQAETTFIKSELIALPPGALARFQAEEPALAPYAPLLGEIALERPHALPPATESALAALGEVLGAPSAIYLRTTSADMSFAPARDSSGQEVPVSLMGYFLTAEVSPDNALRRSAWRSLVEGLKPYRNTLATALAADVKRNVAMARLRGYRTVFDMLLTGEAANPAVAPDMATREFFETFLDIIQKELAPHMRRFARLRRRTLGLDRMLICDVKAAPDPGCNPPLTYGEAAELIQDSVALMGREYQERLRTAFRERWIDRAQNAGRAGMLYCQPVYGVHSYVFSSFTGSVESAFGLAHELGHALHFELTMQHQNLLNSRFATTFVEAPSTMGEHLLARQIRKSSNDPRLRRHVTNLQMNTFHHNFITHLLEGELQRRIYRLAEAGEPVTAALLGEQKRQILGEFWGDEVEIDEDAGLTWMRQPHYYMGLYPYSYSVGLVGSTVVAQMLEAEGETVARRWLEVLKAGSSKPPMELFRMAGVNMEDPATIRQAVAYVGRLVDSLEESFAQQ